MFAFLQCAIQGQSVFKPAAGRESTDVQSADCLAKNNYDEGKCQTTIKALYECCGAFYERHGEDASSVCCPKPKLLQLKLKQLREAAADK
ncbi:protein of unknown function (DUF1903) [Geosmithia morbida]|uniref:Cx9C motif-containing protein 4, mitochondrial n=1 Tax=Geosmithia morbida TaxID=1094350 RepID=A0A9P4YT01_9HYPO|nr:protein of unknown function (DUF1903) [Geosmithia morbida]KAF4122558.1 protein of unknown function (DUF1903) [Geosmithia morbida]